MYGKAELLVVPLLLLAIAVFYICTIRDGFYWSSGDFSLYVHHAKNLATGRPYRDTGYIVNPAFPSHSPAAYPPVFPLLLAPVYKAFGLNLHALKVEMVFFVLLLIASSWLLWRDALPFPYLVAALAVIGLNPYLWGIKDHVISDVSFAVFVYLAAFTIGRAYAPGLGGRRLALRAAVSALAIALACGTRMAGFILLPCLWIYDWLKMRRLTRFGTWTTLLSFLLIALEIWMCRNGGGYLRAITLQPRTLVSNASDYAYAIYSLWQNGYTKTGAKLLSLGLVALAVIGFRSKLRVRIEFLDVFVLPYLFLLWICAWSSPRYFTPLMPALVSYIFYAIYRFPATRRKPAMAAVLALVAATYLGRYLTLDYGSISRGIAGFDSLCAYLNTSTAKSDILVSENPRLLALYTDRPATVYPPFADPAAVWNNIRGMGARYVIFNASSGSDTEYLKPSLASHAAEIRRVYAGGDFEVFRIGAP